MKALILSVKRRKLPKALILTVPLASTRKDEALEWLTYGGNDANPFDVFDQHEKGLIIEALERTVVAYRQGGVFGEVERIKGFEAIARLVRAALAFA
jgi:hypothetical protein